jgi:hypothetical protein
MLKFLDPAIVPVLVSGAFGIIGTIIAGLIGKDIADRKKAHERLRLAEADIAFLLAVEQIHCEMHRGVNNTTHKLHARKEAAAKGLTWSGKFTPGRLKTDGGYVRPQKRRFWIFGKTASS